MTRHAGMTTCGAKTRSGEPCKNAPSVGRDRCKRHGGASLRGTAHPNTVTGRYSKDLPTRMAAHFQAALDDPGLIELRSEAALLEARLADLLKRADTGEAGELWQKMSAAATAFTAASRAGQSAEALQAARDMADLAGKGKADWMTWSDVLRTVDALRRVKDSERKRIESAHNVLTADRAMLLVAALTDAVRRHVSDRKTLDLIGREIGRLADGSLDGLVNGAGPRGAG